MPVREPDSNRSRSSSSPKMASETEVIGWAARDTSGHMAPITFSRRYSPQSLPSELDVCGCEREVEYQLGAAHSPNFQLCQNACSAQPS